MLPICLYVMWCSTLVLEGLIRLMSQPTSSPQPKSYFTTVCQTPFTFRDTLSRVRRVAGSSSPITMVGNNNFHTTPCDFR